ncbi:MAG: hypothetical protein AAF197_09710 [Pseudomonadota bacterium]
MLELIITLAGGAIGGNAAGSLLSKFDQGTLINSIVGILGGGLGGQLLSILSGGALDGGSASSLGGIVQLVLAGGAGGGVLLPIVATVRKMLT